MLYPKNLEQKLGFDKIREWLKEACLSTLGQQFVDKMRFSDHYETIDKLIRQTAEFKDLVQYEPGFPSANYIDANPHLTKAGIEGAFLSEEEVFEVKISLRTIQECLRFFAQKEAHQYPALREISQMAALDGPASGKHLLATLDAVIDDRGHVRDTASPELQAIRRQIIAEQGNLRKRLDSLLRQAKSQGWVSDDVSLTVRGGRMVIPVAAEHKRKIKGFVHDESATGQTVFLEPAEIFDANNEIRELEYRERREIVRILTEVTAQLRPHVPQLKKAYTFLGIIDFIRAKARLAVQLQAINPVFVNQPLIQWSGAKHPLLYLAHQKQGKSIVPLTIELSPKNRILLISGPNAGGKSVLLKTVGLLQYMYQSGLLVPMAEHSQIGLFRNLFIDIGDEQSLENDLSTYSSHLTNMKYFLQFADKKTLFLIDEFGTGTEPSLGGAIAESILDQLNQSKAFGVINTHYTNLKVFADRNEGLINGAMRFDGEKLEPMYELEIGRPGSSFAFEIAHKIGLPKAVVEKAKEKVGTQQVNFEKLLKELDIEKKVFHERNTENATKERKLAQTLQEYTELKSYLDNEKKKLLNEAKAQARQLVKEANQKIEQTIREIRETKAEKEDTRTIRRNLERFEETLKPEIVAAELSPATEEIELEAGEITVGSLVRVKGQTTVGEVLSIKGKSAELGIGELKTNIALNRLEKISRKAYKAVAKSEAAPPAMRGIDINEKMMNFSFNLDLRGKRGEEALTEVDNFLDDALMLGQPELRIIHGKGDGILRNLVRNHLRSYRQVASLTDEHADRGGAGVTIVKMK
jgi:DNA mismatch repair protein MutS2